MITFEQFGQIDLRVAEVVEAHRIGDTRKLLKLRVSLGHEERQVVAELAHFYEPEALVGKQVVLVANLRPGIVHGHRSEGKLLLAHGEGGVLTFVTGDRWTNNDAPVR